MLKYKSLWSELKTATGTEPEHHFIYDDQHAHLDWAMGGNDFPLELPPGDTRDKFKSIECQVMDWADDTAYSLNDLSDSVRAGFLNIEKIEAWAEKHGAAHRRRHAARRPDARDPAQTRGSLRRQTHRPLHPVHPAGNRREFPQRATTNRYRFRLVIDEEVKAESALFKKLAFEVVFLSPQLKQLEHKGSRMLRQLWEVLGERYVTGGSIDGQEFQLLPADTAAEIDEAARRGGQGAPRLRFPRRHDRRLRGAHLQAAVLAGLRLDRRS